MKRRSLLAASLGVATIVIVLCIYKVNHEKAEMLSSPNTLPHLMARVNSDTAFTVYRRRPDNNHWDEGSPFDRNAALSILAATAKAVPWDHSSHAVAYGQWHAHLPGVKISLAWCKDIANRGQRDTQSVHICSGNWLFWYGEAVYQLPREGHDLIETIFPRKRRGDVIRDVRALSQPFPYSAEAASNHRLFSILESAAAARKQQPSQGRDRAGRK